MGGHHFTTVLIVLTALGGDLALADAPLETKPPPWRAAFDSVYRLSADEVVKFVPAPFVAERDDYYRKEFSKGANTAPDTVARWQFTFKWTAKGLRFESLSAGEGRVGSVIPLAGIEHVETDFHDQLGRVVMHGDWIVRDGVPREQVVAAVESIIRKQLSRDIHIARTRAEREVVVARGACKPRPGGKDGRVHIKGVPIRKQVDDETGGGSGDFADFLRTLGTCAGLKVVDETTNRPKQVAYAIHLSAAEARDDSTRRDLVLGAVAEQTGMDLKVERREIDVWQVWEGDMRPTVPKLSDPTGL
jgi:hypothetical protein